jgi:hypothetical protein
MLPAAAEMDIDLTRSWIVGDSLRDTEAGRSAGCKTILISSGHTNPETTDRNRPDHVAVNMREAVNIIKKFHQSGQDARTCRVHRKKRCDPVADFARERRSSRTTHDQRHGAAVEQVLAGFGAAKGCRRPTYSRVL